MKHLKRFNENSNTKTLDDVIMFCKNEIIRLTSGRVDNETEKVIDAYRKVIQNSGIKVFSDEYLKIEEILSSMYIDSYIINDDGSVDVDDNVIINDNVIIDNKLPIKFGKVTKSFNCSNCKLDTLDGSPYFVGGNFDCSMNKLENLKGSPGEVVGSFSCRDNLLTSLEGMSPEIGGNFICTDNKKLKQLDSVSNIEGEIVCDRNVDIYKFSGECKKIELLGYDDMDEDEVFRNLQF